MKMLPRAVRNVAKSSYLLKRWLRPAIRWHRRGDMLYSWLDCWRREPGWGVATEAHLSLDAIANECVENLRGRRVETSFAHEIVNIDAGVVAAAVATDSCGARILQRIVVESRPSFVLEVGSAFGHTSMYLARGQGLINPRRFLGIELEGWRADIANDNLQRAGCDWADVIQGDAEQAIAARIADREVGFVFVDAEHTYDACRRYWELLAPKLSVPSVVAFDDIYWSRGMRRFWTEVRRDVRVHEACELLHRYGLLVVR